jgi:ADP-ribose pyrophosphatase
VAPSVEDDGVWRKLEEQVVYSGYRTVMRRRFETPHGVEDYEVKVEDDSAVVVALTDDRLVVLVREFRPGTEAWLLEIPGGNVDDAEPVAAAASRELFEETGYRATLRLVGEQLDCAYSTRRRHVFVGEGARSEGPSAEGLEVVLMPLDRFRDHLRGGQLTDVAAGYLALDALGLLTSG